jgi:energy-converting hydrogenase Eha subunit F
VTFDASRPTRMPDTRRRRWPRVVALLLAAVLLFGLGVALGLALDDRPVPGGTQTFVRTLEPLPQREP